MRVAGPLRGIRFVTPGKKSVYGKLDCRLALVLDDLASVLERHGVASVRVDNAYRPKARLPGRRTSRRMASGSLPWSVVRAASALCANSGR